MLLNLVSQGLILGRPCDSEAGSSTADHVLSGNVTKLAKRSSTLAEDSNIEVMSCSSDIEVDEFEMPDQDQAAKYEEILEQIKLIAMAQR